MSVFFLFLLFLLLVIGGIVISSLYVVKQQSVAIIERFGRYQKISDSGIHMRAPFGIDKIAARVQLRVLQSEIVVETKTQDNVCLLYTSKWLKYVISQVVRLYQVTTVHTL